jgi:hypothetical protein
MATYVYSIADGTLYSWNPTDTDQVASATDLTKAGLAVVDKLPALDDSHVWNAETKTVDILDVPVPKSTPIATGAWLLRFTPDEVQAIRTSTDIIVQKLVFTLSHTIQIDLAHPDVIGGINYMVGVKLLSSERLSDLLAPPTVTELL